MKDKIYEEWCPIKDYEGLYEISNLVVIYGNMRRKIKYENNNKKF